MWARTFDTIEELRAALVEFARHYNETWLVARHGNRTPAQVRAAQSQLDQNAMADKVGCLNKPSRMSQNRAVVQSMLLWMRARSRRRASSRRLVGNSPARGCEPSVDFVLDKAGIFRAVAQFPTTPPRREDPDAPGDWCKPNRKAAATRRSRDSGSNGSRGRSIASMCDRGRIRTWPRQLDETLHDAGRDGPPRRVGLVGREPFLPQARRCHR